MCFRLKFIVFLSSHCSWVSVHLIQIILERNYRDFLFLRSNPNFLHSLIFFLFLLLPVLTSSCGTHSPTAQPFPPTSEREKDEHGRPHTPTGQTKHNLCTEAKAADIERVCSGQTEAPSDVKQQEREHSTRELSPPRLLDVFTQGAREVGTGCKQESQVEREVEQSPWYDETIVKCIVHWSTTGGSNTEHNILYR